MTGRIVAILLICAQLSPAAEIDFTIPSTQPTSQPSAVKKFPTPAELIELMKQRREADAARSKVAYFDLSQPVIEKPASFSLFGIDNAPVLRDVIQRLHKAREDKSIRAVLLTLGAEMSMSLAQAEEIREELLALRRAGKNTYIYADSYDTIGYSLASGATNVCLPSGGQILIPGVGIETMFYKGTLDKLGVQADYVQIGEYKGAEEPYTRTASSEELKGEMKKLTDALYSQIVDGISLSRNLSTQTVRQMIDDAMMTATVAKERGFVDHLVELDGLRGLLKDELGNEVELVHKYGEAEAPELDFSNPLLLLAAMSRRPEPSDKPAVAVIYADGVITDGGGEGGLLSEGGVGSDPMRKALRIAARDEQIKAIVLRIDSPGGSALASEVIWQAIRRVASETKKPVIVSIGGMAASGGYYLASAGDYIFADRSAIIGSIGVVGGKFVLKDLFDKVGLTTENYLQGRNADLFSSSQLFTDRQRRMMRTWMQQTYDQFTQRVMSTREGKIKDIDKVARGRIFLANQARELGMIDELGGCESAIAHAAKKAGLAEDSYDVRILPAPKTLADLLTGSGVEAATPLRPQITIKADSPFMLLPASVRKAISEQVQVMQLLENRPVILMSPYRVTVK